MSTKEILLEINRLSFTKRLRMIEKAIRSLNEARSSELEKAANEILPDYKNDREPTSFTSIDFENFYEPQ